MDRGGFAAAAVKGGRVKFTIDEQEFLFRVPDLTDLAEVDGDFPLLPVDEKLEELAGTNAPEVLEEIAKDPEKTKRFIGRCNSMLVKCALRPVITEAFPVDPVEGEVPVRSIADNNRIALFITLMALAGFNEEATVNLLPLSETDLSSSISIQSQDDITVDQASSSDREVGGTSSNA